MLVEPVRGKVRLTLAGDIAGVKLWALDPSGQRTAEVAVVKKGQTVSFKLDGKHRAQHSEIVRQ